jgi:hypothetical protein
MRKTRRQPVTRETVRTALGGWNVAEIERDWVFDYVRNRVLERLGYNVPASDAERQAVELELTALMREQKAA